ncbi:uncharacterized protein VTP21DRAFT_6874 [Calcarisporiella thermophila]|uniref:uncharacterized protein n=1 Tax=Calcarisporiella thermophila TaxID=911321 RepID=UPI0037420B07
MGFTRLWRQYGHRRIYVCTVFNYHRTLGQTLSGAFVTQPEPEELLFPPPLLRGIHSVVSQRCYRSAPNVTTNGGEKKRGDLRNKKTLLNNKTRAAIIRASSISAPLTSHGRRDVLIEKVLINIENVQRRRKEDIKEEPGLLWTKEKSTNEIKVLRAT